MKYVIPEMLKIGGGSIVNTASQAGERGVGNAQIYCASKGGVLALSRATAMEYAKKNIRVNCINPGVMATPMMIPLMKDPIIGKLLLDRVPQGRIAEPIEVAYAALFLASDESSHVTGTSLIVDGGMEAWSYVHPVE